MKQFEALISQINVYRAQHSYTPEIAFSQELQQTAAQEVQNLIQSQNFGSHDNFQTLRNEIPNEFLTEIVLKLNFADELPPADVFSQHVVEAIGETEDRYLSYEYTQGGASIQKDQDSGLYFIVIHLAKPGNAKQFFASCKDALEQGFTENKIWIYANGQEKEVTCEQQYADGGWTLALDEHEELEQVHNLQLFIHNQDNIIPIDTMGIEYQEILFKVDDGYEFNSRNTDPEQYKFDGFLFQANAFKFGEKWYVSEEFDINFSYDRDQVPDKALYKQADQITILEPSEICYFEDSNLPNYCAKSFIFNPPLPEGQLTAISDIESIGRYAFENNKWKANFKLYLR